jgi:hypothetical protein
MKPKFSASLLADLASLRRAGRLEPGLKSAARKVLAGYPRLYQACSTSYTFLRFLPMFVKKAVRHHFARTHEFGTLGSAQAILNWRINLPTLDNMTQFIEWLQLNGLHYQEGGHTIYIPPQDKLVLHLGSAAEFYPADAGFKVLKNLGLTADVDYIHGHRGVSVRRRLVGNLNERLLAANFLHTQGIGPRVWDLTSWHGGSNTISVFVVEHVSGREAQADDSVAFLERLSQMVQAETVEILQPNWRNSLDFSLPSCNHNLLYSERHGRFLYVDFQDFAIADREAVIKDLCAQKKDVFHFGQTRFFRDQRYLYQSVPSVTDGKRDTDRRWQLLKSSLAAAGISVKSRVVLDVGCNAGMILHSALRDGALWGFGWDLPSVTKDANDLLLMLGATRFTLTGAQISESYPLEDDIPDRFAPYMSESVVFYLSVSNQLGYLQSLYRMRWRILIYEGHQNQTESDITNADWANFGPDVELVTLTRNADGDSLSRPLALFLRKVPSNSGGSQGEAVLATYRNEDP